MRKWRPSEVIKVSEHQTVFYSICKKPIQTLLLPAMKGYSSLSLCVQPERQKNKKPYFLKLLDYSPRAASINDHKTGAFKQQICILSQSGDQKPESHGDSRGKWAPCLFQLLVAPEFLQAPRLGDAASSSLPPRVSSLGITQSLVAGLRAHPKFRMISSQDL